MRKLSQTKRAKVMRKMRKTESNRAKKLRLQIYKLSVKRSRDANMRINSEYLTLKIDLIKKQYNQLSRKEKGLLCFQTKK